MTLVEQINEGIKESMKSKDTLRLEVLRMLKAKILSVDARGALSDLEVIKLIKTYYGNLEEALEQTLIAKREEMAEKLRKEMLIVETFLPKTASKEETKALVLMAIQESGAKTKKEMGNVMKIVLKMNPNVDAKLASSLVNEHLS
jgi:uncharacterized protein YqeY